MSIRVEILLISLFCAALVACEGSVDPAQVASPGEVAAFSEIQQENELGQVTWALAQALDDAGFRGLVRDAMRFSPYTEHKLDLAEYLGSEEAAPVLKRSALLAGWAPSELLSLINDLPPMDFYMPSRKHRRTWQATPGVLVVAMGDPDSRVARGFDSRGNPIAVNGETIDLGPPVLLIHPAERKGRRINPQPNVPGLVIEDPEDGSLSGSYTWVDSEGRQHTVDLADIPQFTIHAHEHTGGGEGGEDETGGDEGSSDWVNLYSFKIFFGDGVGSSEVEFYGNVYYYLGSLITGGWVRYEGVDENTLYLVDDLFIEHDFTYGGVRKQIHVELWETDAFEDDYKGDAWWDNTIDDPYDVLTLFDGQTATADVALWW